jgi:hypothetical protein
MAFNFFCIESFKNFDIPSAAFLPSNTAVTTKSEPLTISPPENIFGLLVW